MKMELFFLLLNLLFAESLQNSGLVHAFHTPSQTWHRKVRRDRCKRLDTVRLDSSGNGEDKSELMQGTKSPEPQIEASATDFEHSTQEQTKKEGTSTQSERLYQSTIPGPSPQDLMMAMGTNPRRIFLSFVSATGIAIGGNFLGVTSNLLNKLPEDQVEATALDTYFPRGNYKRCRTPEYTFVVPKEWVADTFVELAKAQRKVQPLDYSMQKTNGRPMNTLPDSAYGPPGRLNQKGVSQTGDTNVSVIVSSGLSGFTLKGTLGSPKDAAETLLSRSIAPEGSGRVATLLTSVEDRGGETYKFEYIVDRGTRGPPLQNIAVIAASPQGDKLYTLTVVAPVERWKDPEYDSKLRKIADSFHLR